MRSKPRAADGTAPKISKNLLLCVMIVIPCTRTVQGIGYLYLSFHFFCCIIPERGSKVGCFAVQLQKRCDANMAQNNTCTICVDRVSYIDKKENRSNRSAIHEEIEIKCFYEGSATLLIGSQTIFAKAGDVVVINPYEFHATVDTDEEKGKYHLFMLPLDFFAGEPELDLHKLFFFEGKMFKTLFANDTQMYSLLMSIAEEVQKNQAFCELMIKSLLMTFFTLLLRRGITDAEHPAHLKNSLRLYSVIEPALRCIKNDYARNLTVDHLAKLCNISKPYFCRTFKSITKKSTMEYLRDFRLRVAHALLINTDKSISEISASSGFESPNYFSRCYKKYYGESPCQSRLIHEEKI